MTASERKKELQQSYKERTVTGGIYKMTNTKSGKYLIVYAANLEGAKSRFEFAKTMNSCVHPKMQKEWKEYGKDAFVFEVLEDLNKKETQTDAEFKEDLVVLAALWSEKFDSSLSY